MNDKNKELLERMYTVLADNPKSATALYKEIKVGFYTIKKFLKGEDIGLEPLMKIEYWIKRNENKS